MANVKSKNQSKNKKEQVPDDKSMGATGETQGRSNDAPAPKPSGGTNTNTNFGVSRLLNEAVVPTGLSPAAKGFLDDLTSRVATMSKGQLAVETFSAQNFETALVYEVGGEKTKNESGEIVDLDYGRTATVIFHETYSGPSHIPDTVWALSASTDALARAGRQLPGGKKFSVVQEYVVKPEDYHRVDIYAAALVNLLIGSKTARDLDITTLQRATIHVDTDLDRVMSFIDRHYPAAVKPRADVGFLLSVASPNSAAYDNQLIGQTGYRQESPVQELLAVTGFTEFVAVPLSQLSTHDGTTQQLHKAGATHKFAPIFRITNIVSPLVTPGMLTVALAFATDIFANRSHWLQAYSLRPGQPNIGNLINDEKNKGKPWVAKSIQDRDEFLRLYTTGTYMSVDVLRGMPRIPLVEGLTGMEGSTTPELLTYLKKFFTIPRPPKIKQPDESFEADPVAQERYNAYCHYVNQSLHLAHQDQGVVADQWPLWTGTCEFGEQTVDTRYVDYLNVAARTGNTENLGHLLMKPNDPSEIQRQVSELVNNAKFHYIGYQGLLNPNFLSFLLWCFSSNLDVKLPQNMPVVDHTIQTLASEQFNQFAPGYTLHPNTGSCVPQQYYGAGYRGFSQ